MTILHSGPGHIPRVAQPSATTQIHQILSDDLPHHVGEFVQRMSSVPKPRIEYVLRDLLARLEILRLKPGWFGSLRVDLKAPFGPSAAKPERAAKTKARKATSEVAGVVVETQASAPQAPEPEEMRPAQPASARTSRRAVTAADVEAFAPVATVTPPVAKTVAKTVVKPAAPRTPGAISRPGRPRPGVYAASIAFRAPSDPAIASEPTSPLDPFTVHDRSGPFRPIEVAILNAMKPDALHRGEGVSAVLKKDYRAIEQDLFKLAKRGAIVVFHADDDGCICMAAGDGKLIATKAADHEKAYAMIRSDLVPDARHPLFAAIARADHAKIREIMLDEKRETDATPERKAREGRQARRTMSPGMKAAENTIRHLLGGKLISFVGSGGEFDDYELTEKGWAFYEMALITERGTIQAKTITQLHRLSSRSTVNFRDQARRTQSTGGPKTDAAPPTAGSGAVAPGNAVADVQPTLAARTGVNAARSYTRPLIVIPAASPDQSPTIGREPKRRTVQQTIVDILKAHGPMYVEDIAARVTGHSFTSVKVQTYRLADIGRVTKYAKSLFGMPDLELSAPEIAVMRSRRGETGAKVL